MIEALQIKAKRESGIERRMKAAIAIDFYNNRQYEYMYAAIKKIYPKTYQEVTNYINTKPLTSQIINDRAILFTTPATFELVEGSDQQKEIFAQVLDDSELWKKLIAADRMAELTGKVGMAVHWHPVDGRVVIDIITPDTCYVVQDPHDPTKAIEVYYQTGILENTYISQPVNVYAHWTADFYEQVAVNRDGHTLQTVTNTRIDNPYGRIPIVWFTAEPEIDAFWLDKGYPIVEANVNLNLRETNLDLALDYQSFSTLVTNGRNEKDPIQLGVTRVLNLPNDPNSAQRSEAYYITPDAKLEAVANIIQNKGINAAKSAGLSAESFTRDASNVNSGYQLRLSKQDILNDNEIKKEFYREPCRALVQNILDCYTFNQNVYRFDPNSDISVTYGKVQFDSNPLEQEQVRALKLANKTISRIDIIMEDNPDLTREEALEKAKEIDTQNSEFSRLNTGMAEWTPRES